MKDFIEMLIVVLAIPSIFIGGMGYGAHLQEKNARPGFRIVEANTLEQAMYYKAQEKGMYVQPTEEGFFLARRANAIFIWKAKP